MTAVSLATIRNDLYTKVYNHLQTGTYAITTNNIHPYYNRLQQIQENYPQVIINLPLVAMEGLTMGANKTYTCPASVLIDVYHNSSANAKTVADEVTNKIMSGLSVLRDDGIKNVKFEADDFDSEDHSSITATHIVHINFTCRVVGSF